MFVSLFHWLDRFVPNTRCPKPSPGNRGRRVPGHNNFRPEVTALEDREVPSASSFALGDFLQSAFARAVSPTREVPFGVVGRGSSPGVPLVTGETTSYEFSGRSFPLGRYDGSGVFEMGKFLDETSATFQVSFEFVTANGDTLAVDSRLNPDPDEVPTFVLSDAGDGDVTSRFEAEFFVNPYLSTGRFARSAFGSITLVAETSPFSPEVDPETGLTEEFTMTWSGRGSLEFPRRVPPTRRLPFGVVGRGGSPGVPLVTGETTSYEFSGRSFPLGRYDGSGVFEMGKFLDETSATFQVSFEFVTRNGDKLVVDSRLNPVPNEVPTFTLSDAGDGDVTSRFEAEFFVNPYLSTGRFARSVLGSITLVAETSPFSPEIDPETGLTEGFTMTWGGHGVLEFFRGRRR